MIVIGSRLYGQIDYVPERHYYIATEFAHINYLPLFPTRGWIVTAEHGGGWYGKETSIHFRSVLAAWCRAALIVLTIAMAVGACIAFDQPVIMTGFIAGTILLAIVTWLTYRYGPFGTADDDARTRIEMELGLEPGTLGPSDPYAQWYAGQKLASPDPNARDPQDW